MNATGMFFRKLESKSFKETIWEWLKLQKTPQEDCTKKKNK